MHNDERYKKIIGLRKDLKEIKKRINILKTENKQIPENLLTQQKEISLEISHLTLINESRFGK